MQNADPVVKAICVADTVHDFAEFLSNNQYYKKFINNHKHHVIAYTREDPSVSASRIEQIILNEMHINDDDINTPFKERNASHIGEKLFAFVTEDVNQPAFKQFLGAVTGLGTADYDETHGDIRYISDTSLLKTETICDIQYLRKKGYLVVSEATDFDMGNERNVDGKCVRRNKWDVQLTNTNNLFGLNNIRVYTDEQDHKRYFSYNYTVFGETKPTVPVEITNYIEQQSNVLKAIRMKNKKFLKEIVQFVDHKTLKPKRDASESDDTTNSRISLDKLLEYVFKIYKLNYRDFKFYENNKINVSNADQFVSILLDFKRSSDQLQAHSAHRSKSVFISNDRLSLAYAFHLGIPCIKTVAKKIKNDSNDVADDANEHRKRKLTFYNFNRNQIIDNIFNARKHYFEIIKENEEVLRAYIGYITDMPTIVNAAKIRRGIEKSLNIINLSDMPIQNVRHDVTFNREPNTYIYKYIHIYHIILNLITLQIISHINQIQDLTSKLNEYGDVLNNISLYGLDSVNIDILKVLANKYDDLMYVIKFLDLSHSDNLLLVKRVINAYSDQNFLTVPSILHDNNELNLVNYQNIRLLENYDEWVRQNKTIFYEHLNAITSSFINGMYTIKIPILKELKALIVSWFKNDKHKAIPKPKTPTFSLCNSNLCAEIFLDFDNKQKFITDQTKNIKYLLAEYDKLIDTMATLEGFNINRMRIYKGGKMSTEAPKSGITNTLRQFVNPQVLQKVQNSKSDMSKTIKKSAVKHTPVHMFINHINQIYNSNTNEDNMAKFLIIFMVITFGMFDENGDLKNDDYYGELSPILEESSSHKSGKSGQLGKSTDTNQRRSSSKSKKQMITPKSEKPNII